MWLRSIMATGMQQLTAIAIASAPTSTTPAIGLLMSQRNSPLASVMKASTIRANSPSTESARVPTSAARSSRARNPVRTAESAPGSVTTRPVARPGGGKLLAHFGGERLVARILVLPGGDDRREQLVPGGGLLGGRLD